MTLIVDAIDLSAQLAQRLREGIEGHPVTLRTRGDVSGLQQVLKSSDRLANCVVAQLADETAEANRLLMLPAWLWQHALPLPVVIVAPAALATPALRSGAAEVVVWPDDQAQCAMQVLRACRRFAGLQALCHTLAQRWQALDRLTPRERQVLERLADGWWIKRIAAELGTSPNTVRNQRTALMEKLSAVHETDLVRIAHSLRWFEAVRRMHAVAIDQAYNSSS